MIRVAWTALLCAIIAWTLSGCILPGIGEVVRFERPADAR